MESKAGFFWAVAHKLIDLNQYRPEAVQVFLNHQLVCDTHKTVYIGSIPHPVTVTNEGLAWDSLLKM